MSLLTYALPFHSIQQAGTFVKSRVELPLPAEGESQKVPGFEQHGLVLHSQPCIACHLLFHRL